MPITKINEAIFHFQIDIFAKAKRMNFYHDINTGTLINVKAHRKGTKDKPFTFIVSLIE
jgi:hypothetical protein